ncbi:hypothetical protein Scep_004106 [Stephania cephalantha]|uniref:Uncharacterized protein n=1 Tax=Stephania cephalantha TaxID=152367 RepID=A0AAP0KTM7_9MAGN
MHQRLWSSSSPSTELRHGSSAAHRHFGGRAIFSDPCSICGTKKRRLLTLEDSCSEPDRKRGASLFHADPTTTVYDVQVKPVNLFSRLNACTVTSPAPAKRPPPAPSVLRSFSDITPATAIRDGRSTQADLVRRLKACTVTSPAKAPAPLCVLPPSPDFAPAPVSGSRRNSANVTPIQEWMFQEIKARQEDLKNCVYGIARDELNDNSAPEELCNDADDEVESCTGEERRTGIKSL